MSARWIQSLFLIALLISCDEAKFISQTLEDTFSPSGITSESTETCASFTLIKPKVDFLIVIDNSGSASLINNQVKQALRNIVRQVSDRFDFHILIAPLLPISGINDFSLMVENPEGLSNEAKGRITSIESAPFFGQYSGGVTEQGLKRAHEIIRDNRTNGIFRQNAYNVTVIISNEDDDTPGTFNPITAANDLETKINNLKSISTTIASQMFRIITIVPHKVCQSISGSNKIGFRYMEASRRFGGTQDSFDICGQNFTGIFNDINNSIQSVIIKHKYNFWPVITNKIPFFDTSNIQVRKSNGQVLTQNDQQNGFVYRGLRTNQNTRIEPTPGEPVTAHMIELFGDGQVKHPQCLIVKTSSQLEFYGYIVLNKKPDLGTVQVIIDGRTIAQSSTNGWSYIGFQSARDIKLNRTTPHTPHVKTGEMLQLNGVTYNGGSTVVVRYKPAVL